MARAKETPHWSYHTLLCNDRNNDNAYLISWFSWDDDWRSEPEAVSDDFANTGGWWAGGAGVVDAFSWWDWAAADTPAIVAWYVSSICTSSSLLSVLPLRRRHTPSCKEEKNLGKEWARFGDKSIQFFSYVGDRRFPRSNMWLWTLEGLIFPAAYYKLHQHFGHVIEVSGKSPWGRCAEGWPGIHYFQVTFRRPWLLSSL